MHIRKPSIEIYQYKHINQDTRLCVMWLTQQMSNNKSSKPAIEVKYNPKQTNCKKVAGPLERHDEKRCEINGGSKVLAVM